MTRRALRLAPVAVLALASVTPAARGDDGERPRGFDREEALAISQSAIGRTVGDVVLRDRRGRRVGLASFRGRPVVVSLIYTSCADTCPMITERLADAVEAGVGALGGDRFSVVTIGFDTQVDTPERMRYFARRHGISLPGWRFLSADRPAIDALANDLGFIYFRSPKGFDHLSQTTVLDADGRVYRQIYGREFDPPALVEPLKQLVFGRDAGFTSLSGLISKVRLFCTVYNPASRRYRFDYSLFVGALIGAASLGAVAVILVRAWRRQIGQHGA